MKGATIPFNIILVFRAILPMAASKLQQSVLDKVKCVMDDEGITGHLELGVRKSESINDLLSNDKRVYIFEIRYTPNGRYYNALTNNSFRKYICAGVGSVMTVIFFSLLLWMPINDIFGSRTPSRHRKG